MAIFFLELRHLAYLGHRILDGPEIVHHERGGQQENHQQQHSDAGVKTEQQARSAEQEQDSATAHGNRRRRYPFHLGISGHHAARRAGTIGIGISCRRFRRCCVWHKGSGRRKAQSIHACIVFREH